MCLKSKRINEFWFEFWQRRLCFVKTTGLHPYYISAFYKNLSGYRNFAYSIFPSDCRGVSSWNTHWYDLSKGFSNIQQLIWLGLSISVYIALVNFYLFLIFYLLLLFPNVYQFHVQHHTFLIGFSYSSFNNTCIPYAEKKGKLSHLIYQTLIATSCCLHQPL